jgi:hypothetical protein
MVRSVGAVRASGIASEVIQPSIIRESMEFGHTRDQLLPTIPR